METGKSRESALTGWVVAFLVLVMLWSSRAGVVWGTQLYEIIASDAQDYDAFGSDVAISGDLVIVGAQYRNEGGVHDSGAAYVYDLHALSTSEIKLMAVNPDPCDYFGHAVAIDGKMAVVGAPEKLGSSEPGLAYIFDMSDPCDPTSPYILSSGDSEGGDRFGYDVAIRGNIALVGAPQGNDGAGAAYLFDVSDVSNPIEKGILTANDPTSGDAFGSSAALDGNIAVVGAYGNDDNGDRSGSAYLFDISDPCNPIQKSKIYASDPCDLDVFGYDVGISGDIVIVGAYGDDEAGGAYAGAAYLFSIINPDNPIQTAKLIASDAKPDDAFGTSVSISGNTAIVGAYGHDHQCIHDGAVSDAGAAYLFDVSNPYDPLEMQEIIASDAAPDDVFGGSVSISGGLAVVSSVNHDHDSQHTDSGSVYIFDDHYCLDTNDGLVGYWSFNEGQEDMAYDDSENGNDGTINGAEHADGISGGALYFGGEEEEDYVEIAHLDTLKSYDGTNQMTITAWMFMDRASTADHANVFWGEPDIKMGGHHWFAARHYNGEIPTVGTEGWNTTGNYEPNVVAWRLFDGNGKANDCWSKTVLDLNEWHYVTGTFDCSSMKLYVNGVLDTVLFETSSVSSGTSSQFIGAWADSETSLDHHFPGYIDEFRIYSRALRPAEVRCLYENPDGNSCSGCMGPCHYDLIGDLNNDCRTNLLDLSLMAAFWLHDCNLNPLDPACKPRPHR